MSTEYDCEMDINGQSLGDSKRAGYEKQFKCHATSPSQVNQIISGGHVNHGGQTQIDIDDIHVRGTADNMGNLRTAAGLGKETKIAKIIITRLAKIEGKAEDQPVQIITLSNALFTRFEPSDYDRTFTATISYEEIEIKDIPINDDGSAGSPIVNTYNRLTNTMNG